MYTTTMGLTKRQVWFQIGLVLSLILLTIITNVAFAQGNGDSPEGSVGAIAANVVKSFGDLARLITAAAYVAGMGFAIGAILKFKQHKDNPTQVTIGQPIALLFVAAALIFLPTIFQTAGDTLFEGGAQSSMTGTVEGRTDFGEGGGS